MSSIKEKNALKLFSNYNKNHKTMLFIMHVTIKLTTNIFE